MAALDFPASPVLNQTYTANGKTWAWNGTSWVSTLSLSSITANQINSALGYVPGTVTSVGITVPAGLAITNSPITDSGNLAINFTAGYSIPTTASQTNWDTAYTDRNKWDGGATGLTAATGRTSLGGTTVGQSVFTLTNPSAITFLRVNLDNTVSALDATTFRNAIGAGTVSSVTGGGSVSGLAISGTVTTTGSITLGGTLSVLPSNFAAQAANTVLIAPNGSSGIPTFRTLIAADVPALDASKITTGTFDAARLPSYVDDVLEYNNFAAFPVTGETGKIYVALDTNKTYRWSGTVYVFITSGAVDSVGGYTGVISAANLMTSIQTVDGNGSGLDADLLDGQHASAFYLASNPNGYTTNTGTITGVTATAPVVSSGGSAPIISMPAATSAINGYMTSAYASKLDGIAAGATTNTGTVTSVGGSGTVAGISLSGTITTAGTLQLAGTLSTPANTINDSTLTGQNFIKLTNPNAITFVRINADNSVSALDAATFRTAIGAGSGTGTVTGVTATAPVASSGGTAPVISMAAANTSTSGYLTSTDWNTFNGKQPAGNYATGGGTATGTNTGDQTNISGNASTATNISNTGTVNLATATESNSIYITAPGYSTDTPVKLLNFDWYGNLFSIGNIRSGATASNGFGIYYTASGGTISELARFGTDGSFNVIGQIKKNGNLVLHAGNYNGYSPTLTGTGASGTWGISITGNAATITSQANSATIAASSGVNANQIVQRDGSGYIYASYINSNTSETENSTVNSIYTSNGDGWHRKVSNSSFISQLGLLTSSAAVNNYVRAIGYPSASNDWNSLGNSYHNTVEQIVVDNFTSTSNGPTAASYQYGTLLNLSAESSSRSQIFISHAGNDLIFRGGWGDASWQTWNKVLTNQNYTSYALPLSGGTMSGRISGSIGATYGGFGFDSDTGMTSTGDGNLKFYTNNVYAGGPITGSQTWDINVTGTSAKLTSTAATADDAVPGTGMYPFYNWGGTNGGTNAPSASTYCTGISVGSHPSDPAYGFQIANNMWNGDIWTRARDAYTWRSWRKLLDSANYNDYSPTLTGTGASGTWGINITGSAATATTAPSGTNRGDQVHGSSGVTPATSFISMPSGMPGFTDNWGAGDLPSGMAHVHGIACRHFNNTSNAWGWHMVSQYDVPGDIRVRWVNAGTYTGWYQMLSSSNYNNYSPTLTGGNASGTWGISITGNSNYSNYAGYSYYFPTAYVGGQQTNPQTYFNSGIGLKVAMTGYPNVWSDTLWINGYSGGDVPWMCALHTIRNSEPRMWISAQTASSTTYGTAYEFLSTYNYNSYSPTLTGGNASGTWGINVTGSSASCTGNAATASSTPYASELNAAFGRTDATAYPVCWISNNSNKSQAYSCSAVTITSSTGQLSASILYSSGAITAFSDERVKTNWTNFGNSFVEELAKIKSGTYDRTDITLTQVGVSAQSLQKLMPPAVSEDTEGNLSVSYGHAAMVSAVELAKRVVEQDARIAKLEAIINKLIEDK